MFFRSLIQLYVVRDKAAKYTKGTSFYLPALSLVYMLSSVTVIFDSC